ncbi:MAG: hypothetical protein ACP5M9_02690 [Candidatus Micrarchaeia archaeon]
MEVPKIFTDSFNDIISNPKVFLPSLLFSIITIVIFILVVFIFLSTTIVSNITLATFSPYTFLSNLTSSNLITFVVIFLLVIFLITFFVAMLMNGVIVSMAYQLKTKRKLHIGDAISNTGSKYLNLIGAGFLSILISIIAVGIPIFLVVVILYNQISLSTLVISAILLILALILLIVTSIYLFQVTTVVIIENKGPIAAIKRSFQIATKNRTNIFLTLLITFLISIVVGIISSVLGIIPIAGFITILLVDIFSSVWYAMIPVYFYYESGSNPKQIKAGDKTQSNVKQIRSGQNTKSTKYQNNKYDTNKNKRSK